MLRLHSVTSLFKSNLVNPGRTRSFRVNKFFSVEFRHFGLSLVQVILDTFWLVDWLNSSRFGYY